MSATTDAPSIDLVLLEESLAHELVCCVETCENVPAWAVTWSCGCVALYCAQCWEIVKRALRARVNIWCTDCVKNNLQPGNVVPL